MKEGEKVLEVEPGHANEAVEKPDANAKDDEMKVRELAVALKPATVKENEAVEVPEEDIKITEGEKSVEMEPTSASVKVNDEAVEKADGKAKDGEMKAREAAVALEPASVQENKVVEDPEANIKITDGEISVEMESTSASVKLNDEAVEKADGNATDAEMKAREAAVALKPASVQENEVVEDPEADIKIKLDIVDPKTIKSFNITNGKVVIVGDGIATKGALEFSLVRVDTPAFAACTMSSESTRETRKSKKIFKRKSKFGRSLRKKRKPVPSVRQPSVPSFVKMDATVASTVSSLSNETVRKDSMERSLARREKQVKCLKLDNKKNTRKIAKLSKELTIVKQQFMKEKKTANTLLESSEKESAKVLEHAKSLIQESKGLKKCFDEMKSKEKSKTMKLIREERERAFKKVMIAKESSMRERNKSNELMKTMKQMEENQKTLTTELRQLKNTTLREVKKLKDLHEREFDKGNKLQKQLQEAKIQYHNEKEKRYDEMKRDYNDLLQKEDEIKELKHTLFELSDEMIGMAKTTKHTLKEKQKLELALKRKNNKLEEVITINSHLRDYIEVEEGTTTSNDIKEVRKIKEGFGHGGTITWPLWMVQLILESLVNGTPPSSVPANIALHLAI